MIDIQQIHELTRLWEALIHDKENSLCMTGLRGASRALLAAQLQCVHPHPLLIIAPTPSAAETVFNDLAFFLRQNGQCDEKNPGPCLFPQWEILPYDDKNPHPEIVKERLTTLSRLLNGEKLIIITTIRAMLQRLLPRETLRRGSLEFCVGMTMDLDHLIEEVCHRGYRRTDLVEVPGAFSRRGGILDIFPPNFEVPLRLEFFGDEIESIRLFSPEDQRSLSRLNSVRMIPSREVLIDPPALEILKTKTRGDPHPLIRSLENGESPEGLEFYAPLFSSAMETFFDYLPDEAVIFLFSSQEIQEQAESFSTEIEERHSVALHQERSPCGIQELYLSPEEVSCLIHQHGCINFDLFPGEGEREVALKAEPVAGLAVPGKSRIAAFSHALKEMRKESRICISVRTQGQADRLREILSREEQVPCTQYPCFSDLPDGIGTIGIIIGTLSTGFRFPLYGLACITEDDIFGIKKIHRASRPLRESHLLTNLSELKKGDYVVHLDHGIGRYRGLQEVSVEGIERDLLQIEYGGKDLLYVPPEKLHLIQKYSGSDRHAVKVHRLGGSGWEKLKQRVKKSIEEMSRELIQLYAERKVAQRTPFSPPDNLFLEFEETFEYEETPDQQRAIEEVLEDMHKPAPMDRLVCGDVGFGKTEVALRASFKAVLDGKQVALLVPTTLLAQQHYDSFTRRFSAFPVRVEMLSRFNSRGEQKLILENLKQGIGDIVIGTHRLLSKDVAFKDLGLVVIDEEQRFGVRHKEKLKRLRTEVDVLTLTATPIPRTLEMSFLGIRDISIINTAPEDRLSIYTKVARFSEEIVREAVLRELHRGGQVFFVHNRVRDIDRLAAHVQSIIPEARMGVAHGQMEEKNLKEVMSRFLDREVDLLVTTSIIESGLDIPNANTMIIHEPEKFGLGQLYQLRGRIGRTRHRAYAYLLTRSEKSMSREARQRLQVIQELTELGSGFQLAARDLEIRGAGNLLGPQQSGSIAAVGFDLYMQLVDEVAHDLKGIKKSTAVEPSIHLNVPARIPKTYIREDRFRLDLYRRLSGLDDDQTLGMIAEEIRDRFGKPPQDVENLFRIIELRILAKHLRILEIRDQGQGFLFSFDPETPLPQKRILDQIQSSRGTVRLAGEFQLILQKPEGSFHEVCAHMKNLLQELT